MGSGFCILLGHNFSMPKVLVVGSGGREHALAWKLSTEAEIFAAPGNPGTAQIATNLPISAGDPEALIEACRRHAIDFVVVGPENPLIEGLSDILRNAGVAVFGPSAQAARLEGSKAFAKEVMVAAGVPTAEHRNFTDPEAARGYTRMRFDQGRQVAVKASGAALGKGVVVSTTIEEAEDAIESMLTRRELGDAGAEIVIEDRLIGPEFSLIALCGGGGFLCLPPARDYKRALDCDRGPNTGGMGSYSPVPDVDPDFAERAAEEVVAPILRELSRRGLDYRGALFAGIMVQEGRPYCLEYNVRFGDPETQTLVRRMGSGLCEALRACAEGRTPGAVAIGAHAAVTVVVASAGYPGPVEKGLPIELAPMPNDVVIFHSGTEMIAGRLVTAGGRVIGVSASAPTLESARIKAYEATSAVRFRGARWRTDIAVTA